MPGLGDLARKRLVSWMDSNRKITQAEIAREVGVSQSWVSLYRSGDQDADVDQLAAMARVYGHTLQELIDLRPDPNEQKLLDVYRALQAHKRPLAIEALGAMLPEPAKRRRSGGTQ